MKNIKHYSATVITIIISFFFAQAVKACSPILPIAVLTATPLTVQLSEITFDGSESITPSGTIFYRFEWDWDYDGTTFSPDETENMDINGDGIKSKAHTYPTPGMHITALRVWNTNTSNGLHGSDYDTCVVYVTGGVHNITQAPPDGVWYTNIQPAITAVNTNGDPEEIVVYPGTYNENIDFGGKKITLRSTDPDDWNVVNKTIIKGIDGTGATSVVNFDNSEDDDSSISGFTITNGGGSTGGGILCSGSSPNITNCIITGNGTNSTGFDGGGIACYNSSSPTITGCFICDNKAQSAAGISIQSGSPIIKNCAISRNYATSNGGGIYCYSSGGATITNCTIAYNRAATNGGGGIYIDGSTNSTILNSIIWGNDNTQITTVNSGSSTVNYSDVQGGYSGGNGNVNSDPLFVSFDNPAGIDGRYGTLDDGLRLRASATTSWAGSPCVDAGNSTNTPETDIIGHARADILNKTDTGAGSTTYYDIGAYELNRIWFVTEDADENGDGQSWETPCTLKNALSDEDIESIAGAEIWAAAGSSAYTPGTTRDESFELAEGVAVYGRFAVGDTGFADRKAENLTILSGEIGDTGTIQDNSYHVVKGASGALIDGFIIRDGYAHGESPSYGGGGIYTNASMAIRNCFIIENYAHGGGGIYIDTDGGSTELLSCVVAYNSGGKSSGSGMYLGGRMTKISRCTIMQNSGYYGIANFGGMQIIDNSIVWGNYVGGTPSNIYNSLSEKPVISYSDVEGCGRSGYPNWNSAFGADCGGNIDDDPEFLDSGDLAGEDGLLCTFDDGLTLNGGPCVDKGSSFADIGADDIIGNFRIKGDDVDMGAYESGAYPLDVIAVKQGSQTTQDGKSWATAFTTLQDGLKAATSGKEIWVAAGTSPYYPDEGEGQTNNDRSSTFQLKSGVAVYGGFAGTEVSLSQRNWTANVTILSGDIDTSGNNDSYHVVRGADNATLDGFTIRGGNANNDQVNYDYVGGGMYNYDCDPVVNNCTFTQNSAIYGGGIGNQLSNAIITNCTFNDNSATSQTYSTYGGGIYNDVSDPTIGNCVFTDNTAVKGGGIYNINSSPTVTGCIFQSNYAISQTLYTYGGGVYNYSSDPTIYGCVFSWNTADYGGGMSNISCSPTVLNCTLTSNSGAYYGGGMLFNDCSGASVKNTICWGNTASNYADIVVYVVMPSIAYSNFGTTVTGIDNISQDPLFADAANGDFHLQAPAGRWNGSSWVTTDLVISPCIDTGAPASSYSNEPSPNGSRINMGAYGNTDKASKSNTYIYVSKSLGSDSTGNGTYDNPYKTIQKGINMVAVGGRVFVENGIYYEHLSFSSGHKGFTLTANTTNPVYIDGSSTGSVFSFSGVSSSITVEGFTIQTGKATTGGGAYISASSNVKFDNCSFEFNLAQNISGTASGGVLYISNCSPNISNCYFHDNKASGSSNSYGGAIYTYNSGAVINSCIIGRNSSPMDGSPSAEIYTDSGTRPTYTYCRIRGWLHDSPFVAGDYMYYSSAGPYGSNNSDF